MAGERVPLFRAFSRWRRRSNIGWWLAIATGRPVVLWWRMISQVHNVISFVGIHDIRHRVLHLQSPFDSVMSGKKIKHLIEGTEREHRPTAAMLQGPVRTASCDDGPPSGHFPAFESCLLSPYRTGRLHSDCSQESPVGHKHRHVFCQITRVGLTALIQ